MTDEPVKVGRPTKLTPEVHQTIVDAIRAGASRQAAAETAGVGFSTLKEWMVRGEGQHPDRPQESIFAAFSADVHAAEADFERTLVRQVMEYGAMGDKPDWRAPAWLLERRFSDRWGKVTKTELTGKDGGPMRVDSGADVTTMTDEQLRILAGRPGADPSGSGGA